MGLPLPRYTKQLLHRPHSVPVPVAEALAGERLPAEDLAPVLDHDLDDDVGELDVHDGRHRLLLGAQQRRAEAHTCGGSTMVNLGANFGVWGSHQEDI